MLVSKIERLYLVKPKEFWYDNYSISHLSSENIKKEIPNINGIYKTNDNNYFQVFNKEIIPLKFRNNESSLTLSTLADGIELYYDKINTLFDGYKQKVRISQGDVLVNFSIKSPYGDGEITFPYVVVLSQECDLESMNYEITKLYSIQQDSQPTRVKQFIPNILLAPAFNSAKVFDNTYLEEIYKITSMTDWSSDTAKKRLRQNKEDRYHFLSKYSEIPELVVDFKCYFSVPILELFNNQYKDKYLATVNELFRESLSQRFANYLCRIGLPVIKNDKP